MRYLRKCTWGAQCAPPLVGIGLNGRYCGLCTWVGIIMAANLRSDDHITCLGRMLVGYFPPYRTLVQGFSFVFLLLLFDSLKEKAPDWRHDTDQHSLNVFNKISKINIKKDKLLSKLTFASSYKLSLTVLLLQEGQGNCLNCRSCMLETNCFEPIDCIALTFFLAFKGS